MRARIAGLLLASLCLISQSASAADMPVKARPAPAVAAFSWSSCYVGGNVGWKSGRSSGTEFIPQAAGAGGTSEASSLDLGSQNNSTAVGGGQVGCNWQSGLFVYGLEGDIDAHHWETTRTIGGVLPDLFVPGDTFSLSSRWQASARVRIGYAWDRTLLYATGGVAFTNVKSSTNWTAVGGFPATVTSDNATLVGGTVGGGLEYAFNNNWSGGIEGRYTWYDNHIFNTGALSTVGFPPGGPFTFAPTSQSIKVETAEVLFKLNYKFGALGVFRP